MGRRLPTLGTGSVKCDCPDSSTPMPRRTTGLPSPSRKLATPSPASMASTTGTLSARRLNRPPPNTARSEVHKAALSPDLPEETSLEVVKALIDAGADINAGRQWRTHLGEFVTKGHLEVADLLGPARRGHQHTVRRRQDCSRHRNRARERRRRRSAPRTRRPPRRRAILTPDRQRWAGSLPMHGSLHGL